MPAAAPVVTAGAADIGTGLGAISAEHAYDIDDLGSADPLGTSPPVDLLAGPVPVTSGVVSGIGAADNTEIVVVFTDGTGSLQHTAIPGRPLRWVDADRDAGSMGWYAVVATRATELHGQPQRLASRPSLPAAGASYDLSVPDIPAWLKSEWVKVDSAGVEHSFSDPVTPATPAIRLEWSGVEARDEVLIERTAAGQIVWNSITGWGASANTYRDEDVDKDVAYRYRLRVRRDNGNAVVGALASVPGN
jgi:hypothetical protein